MNDQLTSMRIFLKPGLFIVSLLLSLLIYGWLDGQLHLLFLVNCLSLVAFSISLIYYMRKSTLANYERTLFIFSVFYGAIFIILYKFISFHYNEDYYVFSNVDAALYQRMGRLLSNEPINLQLRYLETNWGYDDFGAFLLSSLLYTIWDSPFNFAVFYLFIGAFTTVCIYRIGKQMMPPKYAFLAALSFSISSFTLVFQSTYLKESLMIFLIVYCYERYYKTIESKSFWPVIGVGISCVLLIFFRPALIIFILLSFFLPRILAKRISAKQLFVILALIIGIFAFGAFIESQTTRYRLTDDVEEVRQDMIRGGLALTYTVNTLAGMFGPIPSILPTKPLVSLYSPGLIFRIITGFLFWIGVIWIFKFRVKKAIPIAAYTVLEIFVLVWILEALELRKSLPHFPFIYIIAFWALFRFDSVILKVKTRAIISRLNYLYLLSMVLVILLWNARYS